MIYGFTTLTESQKCRANNGSTLIQPLPPKKYKRFHSAGKVMASIFCDSQCVIMVDFLEQGRSINDAYYADELRRPRQETARKRRATRGVLLLQNDVPAHTLQVAMIAATECGFEILPGPHVLLISLPLTSISSQTDIPSSWYTVWKQCRRH